MDMPTKQRGQTLKSASQRFSHKPGLVARYITPHFVEVLDRIDSALNTGSLHATLPDGTRRTLGGRAPGFECEVNLRSWNALVRLASSGSVGWYQAWAAGEWTSPDPVPLFALFMQHAARLENTARAKGPYRYALKLAHLWNRNTHVGAQRNIGAHYDLGNDFYQAWLDPTMNYSSGLASSTDGLEAAQQRKMNALLERLDLQEDDSVLEIGCGWGALAEQIAKRLEDSSVWAISLSQEQLEYARKNRMGEIFFRHDDYREYLEPHDGYPDFNAIVSVEMVEALGREYWPTFMDCIAHNLKPGGRAAIQYISMRDDLCEAYAQSADFIQAYIFPGGLLIRTSEFRALAEARGLAWRDQLDFGIDYAETLREWRENFDRAERDGRLPSGFDRAFCDLWRYYLMYCEGGFRGGGIDVHQVTLVKEGRE